MDFSTAVRFGFVASSFVELRNRRFEIGNRHLSRPRPGMMFLIHGLQPVKRQMRVNLGSRNISVAKDGLHRAQVGAIFYHVSGATVAQHVRAGVASHGG